MADIQVIKLKVRRGLNSQRRLVILDEGEIGYTIDTQRLFVGTGTLSGGIAAAPKIHEPLTNFNDVSGLNPEKGDLVYADNKLYQYNNLDSWQFIGSQVDDGTIEYDVDNQLAVALSSINANYLDQSSLSSTSIKFDGGQLKVNYNTTQFTISSNEFALAANAIKPIHIDSSNISKGLVGGAGSPLSAHVDNMSIGFNGSGQLAVIGTPISAISYSKLLSGFTVNPVDNTVSTIVQGVDSTYFSLCGGNVSFRSSVSGNPIELGAYDVYDNGLVNFSSITSSIYDILSCNETGSLSAYNGSPDQAVTLYTPTNGQTFVDALSAAPDGTPTPVTLTSGGFIVFEGNNLATRNNPNHTPGRFAIPVYTF
jgi:hypothetical protein